jgi:hypothetical protein
MVLDGGTDTLIREHCTARLYVSDFFRPLGNAVREADNYGPRTYVIIGHDRLLHSCEMIAE